MYCKTLSAKAVSRTAPQQAKTVLRCLISRQSPCNSACVPLASALLIHDRMNAKTLFKSVFFMAVLLVLLLMGMHNRSPVDFSLPPVMKQTFQQPAALMYFAFFGFGVLTGIVVTPSGRRRLPPIPDKPDAK
jgi:uncharacterized integral membrane protein